MPASIVKQCGTCMRQMPATPTYFHRCAANSDGLYHECKACRNAKRRAREGGAASLPHLRSQRPAGGRRARVLHERIRLLRSTLIGQWADRRLVQVPMHRLARLLGGKMTRGRLNEVVSVARVRGLVCVREIEAAGRPLLLVELTEDGWAWPDVFGVLPAQPVEAPCAA